ncbi:MAG: FHA domain-containing protein [Zoogloeaceae bacterium]|jgi:class 3 adenylate cyclase|nr:FHA domain-containing protein [Zoogloeaceae bacterium]
MDTEAQNLSSVLLAGICDSARLREKLGDTEAARAIERCLSRMERVMRVAKGRIVKATGNSQLMALFESADAAAQAADEIQRQVSILPPVSGVSLTVRIGFHQGEASEENNEVSGAAVDVAQRLVNLAKAGQVLTTIGTVALLSSEQRGKSSVVESGTLDMGEGVGEPVQVVEVLWNQNDESPITFISAQAPSAKDLRLCLRLGGDELWLSENQPSASIGRGSDADLIIHDTRASRNHARIELRHNRYVLIDESVNGTHVKFRVTPELVLRRTEIPLHGRGHIGCGHSITDASGKPLEFEVFDRPLKAGKPEEAVDR